MNPRFTSVLILSMLLSMNIQIANAISFEGSINTGILEYRGATERDGYLLGLNSNVFIFSDFAISLTQNISFLDEGVYKGQKYTNSARILNSSLGIVYLIDIMTLIPFIKGSGDIYSGNFINSENFDYGYSLGAGVRYEKLPFAIAFELSYSQLYKTTTQWPSIILFSISTGVTTNRNKNKELTL